MEKYINKKVKVYEKLYNTSSTGSGSPLMPEFNVIKGTVTGIIDVGTAKKVIELDNSILINFDFIYAIEVIE